MADYRNPLRAISGLTAERVDMGVDYAGHGPLFALGEGVITEYGHGWIGAVGAPYPGTFITERLTNGPDAGKYVYLAEDIALNPRLKVGSKVTANTVLGTMTGGIETGWAVGPSSPSETMAAKAGQASSGGDPGAHPTAYGVDYSNLLASLGAPAGITSGKPVGTVPDPGTTLTSFNPLNPGSWIQGLASMFGLPSLGELFQRLGLILFGGVLIIVGIAMLSDKSVRAVMQVPDTKKALEHA